MEHGIRKVIVEVSGLHASGDTGERDQITNVHSGTCRRIDDTWYIQYQEDAAEGSGASKVLLKLQKDSLEINRKGETSMHLILRSGERINGSYATQFGTIPIAARTQTLSVHTLLPAETYFTVQANYALEMDGQTVSRAQLTIKVRPES